MEKFRILEISVGVGIVFIVIGLLWLSQETASRETLVLSATPSMTASITPTITETRVPTKTSTPMPTKTSTPTITITPAHIFTGEPFYSPQYKTMMRVDCLFDDNWKMINCPFFIVGDQK